MSRSLNRFGEMNMATYNGHMLVTVAALKALADDGTTDRKLVKQAIDKYGIATEQRNPWDS